MSNLDRFLDQNPLTAAGLTEADREEAEPFAEFHCGGLYVLIRPLEGTRYVKMHDSWGPDENIVVHVYDNEDADDPDERVYEFDDGQTAFRAFAWTEFDEAVHVDAEGDLWTWRYYDFTPPALFALVPYDEDACWNMPADTPRTLDNLKAAEAAFRAEYGADAELGGEG